MSMTYLETRSRDVPDVMGAEPRLLRFLGRPDDTSPKATAKMLFGHPMPFDRHDWIVDRGGKEVKCNRQTGRQGN